MTIDEAEKIKNVVENKNYIEQLVNAVAKTFVEAFENIKIEDVNMFRLGYNKAVDDFAIKLKSRLTDAIYQKDVDGMENLIDEIAKQLKGGGVSG